MDILHGPEPSEDCSLVRCVKSRSKCSIALSTQPSEKMSQFWCFRHVHVTGSPCCLCRRILEGRYWSIESSTKPSNSLKPDVQIGCTSESGSSPETFIMYKCKMTHFSLVSLPLSIVNTSFPAGHSFRSTSEVNVPPVFSSPPWMAQSVGRGTRSSQHLPAMILRCQETKARRESGEVQVCRNPELGRATRRTTS